MFLPISKDLSLCSLTDLLPCLLRLHSQGIAYNPCFYSDQIIRIIGEFVGKGYGFVFGAVGIGSIADAFDLNTAIQMVAWITLGSGIFVLLVMKETRMRGITISK